MGNKTTDQLERELREVKNELETAEYELRWSGFTNPMDYIRSVKYSAVSYLRRRESEIQREISDKMIHDK
jgi:hypothetical protein